MTNDLRTINAAEYNDTLAEALEKMPEFKAPEWVHFVKSSPHKERPTQDTEFWYKRAASILRQIYINEIVGVNRLRTRYGGKKDRGSRPSKFVKSGGKIIRTILQQADTAGFTEKTLVPRAGRKITAEGKEFLESIKVKGVVSKIGSAELLEPEEVVE